MNITETRHRLGFTRAQLADALGCSVEAVKSWELGRRNPPGLLEPALRWVLHKNGSGNDD